MGHVKIHEIRAPEAIIPRKLRHIRAPEATILRGLRYVRIPEATIPFVNYATFALPRPRFLVTHMACWSSATLARRSHDASKQRLEIPIQIWYIPLY